MNDHSENQLNPDDELKAENEVLRLKLELEHGMLHSDTSTLSSETENQWLNYIYNFEKLHKEAKRVKVYDFISRPEFIRIEDLQPEEVPGALKHLLSVMEEKSVGLDCICEYEDSVIYRFITEELFAHEIDDIFLEGMMHNFIYEEFHPNHSYDLRQCTEEFIENVFQKKWNPEFHTTVLADAVSFRGNAYDNNGVSAIILSFQEAHNRFQIEKFEIEKVNFDVENGEATVLAALTYTAENTQGRESYAGNCTVSFTHQWGFWHISSFQLPGLGD